VQGNVRAFSVTVVTLVVATGLAWVNGARLVEFWLAQALEVASRTCGGGVLVGQQDLGAVTLKLTIATAALLAFPVFSMEAWLLVCRRTRRERARRLALPFGVVSACGVVVAFLLAYQVEFSCFAEFLPCS
jgi:hypothetical protein